MALITSLIVTALIADQTPAAPAQPIHNYLKGAESRARCGTSDAKGEIVVCARDDGDQQLKPLPDGAVQDKPLRAETTVPGVGKADLHSAASKVGGAPGVGAAVTLTIPF